MGSGEQKSQGMQGSRKNQRLVRQIRGSNISRRGLLLGGIGVVSMVAVGGVAKAFAGEGSLVRPPGAYSEAHLLGACIKCDRCRSACPQNVIDVGHIEEGFLNARTPKLQFRKGYCDFCDNYDSFRCVESCPTGALLAGFDPLVEKVGRAEIDTGECLLYRSSSCSKPCIDICDYDALWLDASGHVQVIEDACNGCGACEFVCPSSSYGTYTGSKNRGINVWPVEMGRL